MDFPRYAVLQRVKEMTGGKVSLTTGTLYGTIDRLVDEGLIRRAGSDIVRVERASTSRSPTKDRAPCS